MKYRALSATGDYVLGASAQFYQDSPEAVAQAIKTRLELWTGQWFLNTNEGTDYAGSILGHGSQDARDLEVKSRILETPGVLELVRYSSSVTPARKFQVAATVATRYGQANVITTLGN